MLPRSASNGFTDDPKRTGAGRAVEREIQCDRLARSVAGSRSRRAGGDAVRETFGDDLDRVRVTVLAVDRYVHARRLSGRRVEPIGREREDKVGQGSGGAKEVDEARAAATVQVADDNSILTVARSLERNPRVANLTDVVRLCQDFPAGIEYPERPDRWEVPRLDLRLGTRGCLPF